jgi:hypothetical protein
VHGWQAVAAFVGEKVPGAQGLHWGESWNAA